MELEVNPCGKLQFTGYTALPLCYEVQEPHPQPPPRKRRGG